MHSSALSIRTNAGGLRTQTSMRRAGHNLQESVGRLSSGLRVRRAQDDSAKLAMSQTMSAQRRGFQQAQRNVSYGISMLQNAEGHYQSISDTLIRMRELSVEAASDALSDTERSFLDQEFQELSNTIRDISNSAEHNGIKLLSQDPGQLDVATFQVGTRNSANDTITWDIEAQDPDQLGLVGAAVDTRDDARTAIDDIDNAMNLLMTDRSELGSVLNQLRVSMDHLSRTIEDYGTSVGVIRDADVSAESATFTKQKVLQEASVAMLSQANAAPQIALRLLG